MFNIGIFFIEINIIHMQYFCSIVNGDTHTLQGKYLGNEKNTI